MDSTRFTTLLDRSTVGRSPLPQNRESAARTDFASVLGRMGKSASETPEQLAHRTAESFVAMTFVQPLLKELRSSNHTAAPFAPTEGEKQFQGLMDAQLAQRIVSTAQFPLVDKIASDILSKSRRAAGGPDAAGQSPLADTTAQVEEV